jgi:hypothetical protein
MRERYRAGLESGAWQESPRMNALARPLLERRVISCLIYSVAYPSDF